MAGKEVGVFSFGYTVLAELRVKLSDGTAEGNRCLLSSLQARKKRTIASPLFPSTPQPIFLCLKVWL